MCLVQRHVLAATSHHHGGIVGRVGNRHLGVDERVTFAVGELVAPLIGIFVPCYLDLILVDRCLEGFDGSRLRHAGHRADIGIGGLVVDDEQIAVAMGIGLVFRLTGSMTIARVTVETAAAHIDGAQTVKSTVGIGVVVFLKEILALVESSHHTCILYCLRGLLKGRGGIHGSSTQLSACIVILRIIGSGRVANFPRGGLNGFIIVGTSNDDEST